MPFKTLLRIFTALCVAADDACTLFNGIDVQGEGWGVLRRKNGRGGSVVQRKAKISSLASYYVDWSLKGLVRIYRTLIFEDWNIFYHAMQTNKNC